MYFCHNLLNMDIFHWIKKKSNLYFVKKKKKFEENVVALVTVYIHIKYKG